MIIELMRRLAVCALLSAMLAAPASAGPAKLTPQSDYGLIAVEAEPASILRPGFGYDLNIVSYSVEEGRFTHNSFKGWAHIRDIGKEPGKRYYLRKAKPGVYGVLSASIFAWGTCFNGGSFAFDVQPGKVTFIGRFAGGVHSAQLLEAVDRGQLPRSAGRNEFAYLFDEPRPALTGPDALEDWRGGLEAYLKAEEPQVSGEIVPATLTPIVFNTGSDAFGARKLCGGYYAKAAGPQTSPAPARTD